ncbi:hypothetical protein trd_A0535 (plasmid) [Thermomicrobium roseum DSM 5159]|uniref:Uncharacterized protein n=1 Tax=Thermomicrobium roseum (strain ATCC 27502 / DSM 5159 / P-2) TaxID=309801 RepID=B9L421_THERP|nr:hypothetical protein trd_A0535 [Thermomicrobium roseum DSM 5159]
MVRAALDPIATFPTLLHDERAAKRSARPVRYPSTQVGATAPVAHPDDQ